MSALAVQSSALSSCITCQAGIEFVHRHIAGGLHLATFLSFCLVSIKGIIYERRMRGAKQFIPTSEYWKMVAIFFVVNWANNSSLNYEVSMPLYIMFKSGSLIANVVLVAVLRRHIYPLQKLIAILITTVGLVIFTLASSTRKPPANVELPIWSEHIPFSPFWIGVFLMASALVLSAYLGILQEDLFRSYGRHHTEALFFIHFLSLPGFALVGDSIYSAFKDILTHNGPQILGVSVPLWLILLGTCVIQYTCVSSVFKLASICPSLDVTMLLSVRKMISLILSIYVFGNDFTSFHCFGAAAVFLGGILFSL